jgi:hypothetical protein
MRTRPTFRVVNWKQGMNRVLTLSLVYAIVSVAHGASAHAADRAAPTELARSPGASCDLRTDAQFIYWTTSDNGLAPSPSPSSGAHGAALKWPRASSTVMRVSVGGGAVTRLAKIKGNWAFLLRLDHDHLYWTGLRTGEIWRMPKAGGVPVRVDDGAHKLMGTATDATYVYASDRSAKPEGILRIPKDGGAATLVSESRVLTLVLGVDHDDLYWAERVDGSPSNGWLLRTVATRGQSRTLAQVDAMPGQVVFSDDIYFIAGSTAYGMSRTTGALRRLASVSAYGDRGAIAVDNRYLYWGEGKTGELKRVPKSGGSASVVATGTEPCGVLVNGQTIFWMDRGGYRLMRMPIGSN